MSQGTQAADRVTQVEPALSGLVWMVGEEPNICTPVAQWLTNLGCEVDVVQERESGLTGIRERAFYLVVIGDSTESQSAVDIVKAIRDADAHIIIVLISRSSCETGFQAGRAGADLVLAMPIDKARFDAHAAALIGEARTRRRQVAVFRALDGQTSSAVTALLAQATQLETSSRPVQETSLDLAPRVAHTLLEELTLFEFLAVACVLRLITRNLVADPAVFDQMRAHLEHAVQIQAGAVDPVIMEIVARLEDAGPNCRHISEAQMSGMLGATRAAVWKALAGIGLDFVQIRKAVTMRRAGGHAREDSPVKLVAFNLGYNDESHFMHDFSRFFGISLQKFRGLLKN